MYIFSTLFGFSVRGWLVGWVVCPGVGAVGQRRRAHSPFILVPSNTLRQGKSAISSQHSERRGGIAGIVVHCPLWSYVHNVPTTISRLRT